MSFKHLPVEKPELRALGVTLGEDRVRAIVHRFYRRMAGDVLIGFFFEGRDIETIADLQSSFLFRAMGLRPSYTGKAPADAHTALPPILAGHFDRRLMLLDQQLTADGLDAAQRAVWVGFENAFRDSILGT
jgi:truncated hemoglobin YjbI